MTDEGGNAVRTRTARVWLEQGIARITYEQGAEITMADAEENLGALRRFCPPKRPLFIDTRGVATIDREARNAFSSKAAAECQAALALLVGSPVSRLIGSFFLGLNKPPFPTRLFTSESDALAWLKQESDAAGDPGASS